MKYIIVDLEATCWEPKRPGSKNEIIEIGALCVNENKEIESEFSEFVKPTLDPVLSEFCTRLTSITQEQVNKAETFPSVIKRFREWIGEDYILCSWGHYDKAQFKQDCLIHKLDFSWLNNHISLKHQHGEIKRLRKPVGMRGALGMENLNLEGTHHRGIDDARNITKIFLKYFDKWKYQITK
ncbi:MAG: 3-5 exonuclease [Bacteroidetes bacterium]|nr:3-5 exonuclease [Bacteroidota bacterium]